ncbi:MAG: cell division protein SepF [ANME-2 cluster archaeon]|nr:cell division protein SepF [ANME-2 cluster archaeon]MCL7476032.1 cell division protein SepF [ANME-2 cluster archaeon]MDF1532515.1 cell division protein SepF [ANME-2 cluster archaeon]MDW7776881.1 cell division protein SepF [Methanosarcinales archaeon]
MVALKKIFGGSSSSKSASDEYVDLDLSDYEEVVENEPAEMYIRIAELNNLNDIPDLKKEIYNGNVLLVDISLIKQDKFNLDRAIKELKQVVEDTHGDIAGIGEDQVIVAPMGVRINRSKIIGVKK